MHCSTDLSEASERAAELFYSSILEVGLSNSNDDT